MKNAFRRVGSNKPLAQWITLVLNGFCLAAMCRGTDACPADATAPGVQISVAAYRQDGITPVGTGSVGLGETLVLRSAICYVPVDPISESPLSAVEQGNLTITFNGVNYDVTPASGIPTVGCEGMPVVQSTNLAYVVTQSDVLAGAIIVRADYIDGIALLSAPVSVHVIAHAHVRVRPTEPISAVASPLSIHKTSGGAILLSFTGEPLKTYRIEATTDFAHWTPLGSVVPNASGLCQANDVDAHNYSHRFYRYVVVN